MQTSSAVSVINTVNPVNDEVLASYTLMSSSQVSAAIDLAQERFSSWKNSAIQTRCTVLLSLRRELRKQREALARLITLEMGKPYAQALAEIDKSAWVCEYYAKHAADFLQDELVATEAGESFVSFEAMGLVFAVMPWNFPFWQVFRFAAPCLAGGNVCLLKHANNVAGCALAIEKLFRDAGAPPALFTTLLLDNSQVAEVIQHQAVAAVTLTGSTGAGRAIASIAGEAIKKTVLELGGSDPYIILDDADIVKAAELCAQSRLINSGQSCISAKRFIVLNKIKSKFEQHFCACMRAAKMGDPFDPDTLISSLARRDLRDTLHGQVEQSVSCGAKLMLGGELPSGSGAFYPATVLSDVPKKSFAYQQELFGPVAAIIPVADEDEAISVANDSVFGLGAAIFTAKRQRALALARKLQVGTCTINDMVKSDPRLPFGGVKQSGYGRELSHYGLREFINIKTIIVN